MGLFVVIKEAGFSEVGLGLRGKTVGLMTCWIGGRVNGPIGDMVKTPCRVVPSGVVGLIVGRAVGRVGRPGLRGLRGRFGRLVVVKMNGGRVKKGLIVERLFTIVVVIEIAGAAVVICIVVGRIPAAELSV
jgi:hypothetical protein